MQYLLLCKMSVLNIHKRKKEKNEKQIKFYIERYSKRSVTLKSLSHPENKL